MPSTQGKLASKTTPQRASLFQTLQSSYSETSGEISDLELEDKLGQGLALVADLDLEPARTLIRNLDPELLNNGNGELIKTASVQRLIDALCQLSMRDSATGLFNRRYFEARLVQELHRAHRELECCSVGLIDFDHLKHVNDRYGHAVGDKVLAHLSELMVKTLRTTDISTRIGGDEFAVILPNTDARQALCAVERLKHRIETTPLQLDKLRLSITISAGISTCQPAVYVAPEDLVKHADEALYRAKAAGRNRVEVYGEVPVLDSKTGVSQEEKDGLL